MDTLESLRHYCNSGLCVQDARSILVSSGHAPDAVQDAINTLIMEDVSVKYTLNATSANIFLTSAE